MKIGHFLFVKISENFLFIGVDNRLILLYNNSKYKREV